MEGYGGVTVADGDGDCDRETSYTSEEGHKIAFDPRDLSESHERSKQPKLTIMEEVLLLGLKDKQVYTATFVESRRRGYDELGNVLTVLSRLL